MGNNEDMTHSVRNLIVAIPIFKTANLLPILAKCLLPLAGELNEESARVIFIDNSPDDFDCSQAIDRAVISLENHFQCETLRNDVNLGFIESANKALIQALHSESDLLLLNSDALLTPGAIREIRAVAYEDPMIGFVAPRSNNASISTIRLFDAEIEPVVPSIASSLSDQSVEALRICITKHLDAFKRVSRALSRYQYVPTVSGFCMYIKNNIIGSFGFLDPAYGKGYQEENDYIMRASRCGYRAVLANRAFVFHLGELSFGQSDSPKVAVEKKNSEILNARYPEYSQLVADHYTSAAFLSESFAPSLARTPIELVIDATSLSTTHDGTAILIKKLCENIAKGRDERLKIYIMAETAALAFHGIDRLPGVTSVPPSTRYIFSIGLKIGQPFSQDQFTRLARIAAINVYFMLDTIAIDCSHLRSTQLEEMWTEVCRYSDGIIYNSEFTKRQFERRFLIGSKTRQAVSHHSVDPLDYGPRGQLITDNASHILIVGNDFPHKFVAETYKRLRGLLPDQRFWVLGGKSQVTSAGDKWLTSGKISPDEMVLCYSSATAIVFPSHYEGFGFPILEAISYRKPVFVRNTEINTEIRKASGSNNIHFYDKEEEVAAALRVGVAWIPERPERHHSWVDSASNITDFILDIYNSYELIQAQHRIEYMSGRRYNFMRKELQFAVKRALWVSLMAHKFKRFVFWPMTKRRKKYGERVKAIKLILKDDP